MLKDTFILIENSKTDNKIEQVVKLIELIDSGWLKIEKQIEAITKNLQYKLEQEKVGK